MFTWFRARRNKRRRQAAVLLLERMLVAARAAEELPSVPMKKSLPEELRTHWSNQIEQAESLRRKSEDISHEVLTKAAAQLQALTEKVAAWHFEHAEGPAFAASSLQDAIDQMVAMARRGELSVHSPPSPESKSRD